MGKDMTLEINSKQSQDASSGNAPLLPYTAPKLFIYNQAEITLGGTHEKGNLPDSLPGVKAVYKVS